METVKQFKFKRLIIVAYRSPFGLVKKNNRMVTVQNSGGLVSAVLSLSEKLKLNKKSRSKILWVGTGDTNLSRQNVNTNIELYPVDIPDDINEKYYGGFCNNTIWPLFHYFPAIATYDPDYFEAYTAANELFFQKLKELVKPGDFIWIHDYHLFLLPKLIRNKFPEVDIGFFLHIPFPSFELFRLLPRTWRESILSGITGADMIGFHTYDYSQYFLKSVKRTLGYEIDQNHITIEDRICKADAFPIGIDYDKFHNSCKSPMVMNEKTKLKKQLSGNKLIFSVDRLDYTKGILNRLKAYERFLVKYPKWNQNVVFNMVVVPSRDNIPGYQQIKKEIEETVGRINGSYSTLVWRPLVYQYKSLSFKELVALYDISDVGLITPLRDGMNLVAKEYVACKSDNSGMLVLSEMTGAASELNEAIIINPTDIEETADAIFKALEMPAKEKENKILKMQNRISRYNVFTWANDFFSQTLSLKEEQKQMSVRFLDRDSLAKIHTGYIRAEKRLILIDYDGTLVPLSKSPETALLNEKAETTLKKLTSDSKNKIVIISGRERNFIEDQFKSIEVMLIAEHGYFIKNYGKRWVINNKVDLSWKKNILPLLNEYVERCTGSIIENKRASLAWHYINVDEEFAIFRIHELKDDLTEILKNNPKLQVLEGNKVLEIKSVLYDKGTAVSDLLAKEKFDFIMALGDDKTDEDLFRAIPEYGYTIKIGLTPSTALFNIKRQSQIYEILNSIV